MIVICFNRGTQATIFTKIINREIPAEIVYENDYVIVIKDINPIAPVHILVITKKEIPTLNDVTNEDAQYISEAFSNKRSC